MKNVHVLPTDKPSRLQLTQEGVYYLIDKIGFYGTSNPQHIYITSSDEEIKEGDWILDNILVNKNPIKVTKELLEDGFLKEDKKIILTTDQDLINDGVQAIDDEFLEWFVKNPSCEEVDLDTFSLGNKILFNVVFPKEELNMIECYFTPRKDTSSATICSNCGQEKFLHTIGEGIKISTYIVNAKEEPKQHLIDTMKRDEELGLYEEPKQETLEEAAENRFGTDMDSIRGSNVYDLNADLKKGFIEGAKYQAERSYSKEDLRLAWEDGREFEYDHNGGEGGEFTGAESFDEWFKNLKKKL